jgi:hypothetical protein
MTFAGNENRVIATATLDRRSNGFPTIMDDFGLGPHSFQNTFGDGLWGFSSRVIIGNDYVIRMLFGYCSHNRTLFIISISAAAKNTHQITLGYLAQTL